ALAVQQARAQLFEAKALLPQFEQQIALQEDALGVLLGSMPATIPRQRELTAVVISDTLNAGIPAALLSRRPDIRSAQWGMAKANADVGAAKASLYPSLTITAQAGFDALKASDFFNIPG